MAAGNLKVYFYEFLDCEGVSEVSFRNAPALQCGSLRSYQDVVPHSTVCSEDELGVFLEVRGPTFRVQIRAVIAVQHSKRVDGTTPV